MKGILGRKVGMTEVFSTNGKLIPVTVIEVDNNVVTQVKTVDKDGYEAIQLGVFDKKEKSSNKPEMGHAKKANTLPKRFVKEIRGVESSNYTVGQVIDVNVFETGEVIDVTGISKGKGFQGAIKRWNQSRGPETHGSTYHRRVGSLGTMRPMRVFKGKKLPGRMGGEQVTIQNLEVISIDSENNCILVSGNVPGAKGTYVFLRSSIKGTAKRNPVELISYEEQPVQEEIVSETVEVSEPVTTEEVNETVEEVNNETPEESKEEVSE
jgi:large subunit ribosomal protein L3